MNFNINIQTHKINNTTQFINILNVNKIEDII